eukprot:403367507
MVDVERKYKYKIELSKIKSQVKVQDVLKFVSCNLCQQVVNYKTGVYCSQCQKPTCGECFQNVFQASELAQKHQVPCRCKEGERLSMMNDFSRVFASCYNRLKFKCKYSKECAYTDEHISGFLDENIHLDCQYRELQCKLCGLILQEKQRIAHEQICLPQDIECNQCKMTIPNTEFLQHQRIHKVENEYDDSQRNKDNNDIINTPYFVDELVDDNNDQRNPRANDRNMRNSYQDTEYKRRRLDYDDLQTDKKLLIDKKVAKLENDGRLREEIKQNRQNQLPHQNNDERSAFDDDDDEDQANQSKWLYNRYLNNSNQNSSASANSKLLGNKKSYSEQFGTNTQNINMLKGGDFFDKNLEERIKMNSQIGGNNRYIKQSNNPSQQISQQQQPRQMIQQQQLNQSLMRDTTIKQQQNNSNEFNDKNNIIKKDSIQREQQPQNNKHSSQGNKTINPNTHNAKCLNCQKFVDQVTLECRPCERFKNEIQREAQIEFKEKLSEKDAVIYQKQQRIELQDNKIKKLETEKIEKDKLIEQKDQELQNLKDQMVAMEEQLKEYQNLVNSQKHQQESSQKLIQEQMQKLSQIEEEKKDAQNDSKNIFEKYQDNSYQHQQNSNPLPQYKYMNNSSSLPIPKLGRDFYNSITNNSSSNSLNPLFDKKFVNNALNNQMNDSSQQQQFNKPPEVTCLKCYPEDFNIRNQKICFCITCIRQLTQNNEPFSLPIDCKNECEEVIEVRFICQCLNYEK